MKVFSKVSVNTHYTRSVNVERDAGSKSVVQAYIPTSRALRTFERVISSFSSEQAPRAWSLVGPYGSGKSSFAVFIAHLLGDPSDDVTKAAYAVLKKTDETLAKKISSYNKSSMGFCKVVLTGSPESLGKRILQALHVAAKENLSGKSKVVTSLQSALEQQSVTTSELINLVSSLQDALAGKGFNGIIFTIDELGKFLEYEARHYGANDIFLLQALAEHACKGHEVNLFLFVLLHQSFEQYAKGLGESLKKEWSKVQGRFEEIPFLESAEQILRVVSAAFDHSFNDAERKSINSEIGRQIDVLQAQGALPPSMSNKEAVQLFSSCYPLHPVSAILLPLLCQKIAQNERTLFSYLGSQETNGLSDLAGILDFGEFVKPHHIYDYFITNQPAVIGDHFTHRRWVEVITALDRLGDASEETAQLLKTIGILNIVGAKGGLKASKELLELCFPEQFKKVEKELVQKSLVAYRKFNGEYRVWQGSDFDLEEALREEQGKLGNFSLAKTLSARKAMLPVVARRYTIESGALRYFQPIFVDAQSYKDISESQSDPTIIFFLASGQDDERYFYENIVGHFSDLCIVALCLNGEQLREATAEVLALQQVQITRQELNSDPIAKREFQDRLTAAELAEDELLQNLMEYPDSVKWFWKSKSLSVRNKRHLQQQFSLVLESVYAHSPTIQNELLNRDKPSSQATAARNKLLYAILNNGTEIDLGIDKFPPEKAIYRSILRESGLHKKVKGEWRFTEIVDKESHLYPVWNRINQFLNSTQVEPKSFAELNQELLAPPFGVKAGVLPVLYIAAYAVYQHELALYESRVYRPYFNNEMLERFVKRPDEFTVQRFRIKGVNESLFKEYAKALRGNGEHYNFLDLAKALANEMGRFPEYTQKTEQGLSKKAINVRSAFNLAKSPVRLLFKDLPVALGFEKLDEDPSDKQLAGFTEAFTGVLREMREAYPTMLDEQRKLLAIAFNLSPKTSLSETRKVISGYCHGLENYTVDGQGVRPFIMRLTKPIGSDEEWLENILMFLANGKPSKKWADSEKASAEYRLASLSRGIIDLEKLRLHERDRAAKLVGDFDVYLLRTFKKGEAPIEEVVAIDAAARSAIQTTKNNIFELIQKEGMDNELALAAVAEFVDDFMKAYRDKNDMKQKKDASMNLKSSKK